MRDMGQLVDRFRATNRLSLKAYKQLSSVLTKARKAEANGDDGRAVRHLRTFVSRATDGTLVRDADVRSVLERDGNAVIGSLNGDAVLPRAVNG